MFLNLINRHNYPIIAPNGQKKKRLRFLNYVLIYIPWLNCCEKVIWNVKKYVNLGQALDETKKWTL